MNRGLVMAASILTWAVGAILAQRGVPEPANPFQGNPGAVHEGEGLYAQHCTGCHGPNGSAGEIGPAIVSGERADFGAGDAQIFWGKGQCGTCHMLGGRGGLTAPDLNNIAGTRKASTIIDALTKEQHHEFGSGGAHLKSLPPMDSYLPVHLTTADGKVIDGVLLNQDGYSLEMIGNDQRLHSFDRAKLRRIDIEPKSLMPTDYGKRLTTEELKDLLAFLTRQGTKSPPARGGPTRGDDQ